MELPRSLAPWAAHLDLFPREVGLALGPLVRHVALAVGPLRSHALTGSGEPDGFDDLANRGSYDRLLASEWLLADELPDEFARRAAMGEHLFLRVGRREPARSRMSLALFDAGPNQLGTPRIAHLAALVALAHRAEVAGARFAWGTIQHSHLPPSGAVTPDDVLRLLATRTAIEAREYDATTWSERIAQELDLDDVWVVGGARLGRLRWPEPFGRLVVRDVLEPGARQLVVEVRSPSAAPREARLELPDDQLCTRLVRDPYDAARAIRRDVEPRAAPASNLFFDSSGVKLFARGRYAREVIVYPVPNSPRAGAGRPRYYGSHHGPVLAAGRINRSVVLATIEERAIRLSAHRGDQYVIVQGPYGLLQEHELVSPAPDDGRLLPVVGHPDYRARRTTMCLLDGRDELWRLNAHEPGGEVRSDGTVGSAVSTASGVLAIAHLGNQVYAVGRASVGGPLELIRPFSEPYNSRLPVDGDPTRAFFGWGGTAQSPVLGLLALELAPGRWTILGEQPRQIELPESAHVAGVVAVPSPDEVYYASALVTIEENGRALVARGDRWRRTLHTFAEPIAHATVSPAAPHVAYATASGEVGVYSLAHKAFVCRFAIEGGTR